MEGLTENDAEMPAAARPAPAGIDPSFSSKEAIFAWLQSTLNLEGLPDYCDRVRRKRSPRRIRRTIKPVIIEEPFFGSYYALYPIRFKDGVRWILRVPICAVTGQFDELASSALASEAETMTLICQETSVPVPRVMAYGPDFDNVLRVPFILMTRIRGKPLHDIWFDKLISREELMLRRKTALRNIARLMVRLGKLSFKTGGALEFINGNLFRPGPLRTIDHGVTLPPVGRTDGKTVRYFEAGPFAVRDDYYLVHLSREENHEEPEFRGVQKLLRTLLQWNSKEKGPKFVVTHPNLSLRNILISENERVMGFIDWNGVAAMPLSVGNEKYPSWLSRDWNPCKYEWNDDVGEGINPGEVQEDSLEILELHHKKYSDFMQYYLALREPSTPSTRPSITHRSLIVENLIIAADNMECRHGILAKIFEEIVKISCAQCLSHSSAEGEEFGSLEMFQVVDILARGEMEESMSAFLKKGFNALLSSSEATSAEA
ncbi:hypothetical protein LOZ07_004895 [Ophidiomyces ophidiicola]|nr:hypothetical protein LOZ07_004895 [Ophidiomyces ophidiicola]